MVIRGMEDGRQRKKRKKVVTVVMRTEGKNDQRLTVSRHGRGINRDRRSDRR